ncbi:MAG: ABC transporter ATP-binding protein [candidate division Zixibacteria bacterium]|nr:ABC transporter ATP-binding protein [candidate division Zixibacteria bacterium]
MDSTNCILSATDVCREFKTAEGTLLVLNGISLEVKKGQMTAVTGASGVGKSTLLHLLGGLDRPTRGEVTIGGASLAGMNEAELARFRNKKVGFVFQFHYLLDDFTALENVTIPIILAGCSHAEATRRGELLIDQVGLSDRQTHRPKELSGGEQQRVAVARALANEPEIVLADEPTGNLDTATGRRLHELLFELSEKNNTSFLVATHNRELADRCDYEYLLADGKLSAEPGR